MIHTECAYMILGLGRHIDTGVIDVARSVLSKVDLCRLALARMVMADRASNIYIDVYIPIQLSPTCELSSLGLLICRESGSRAAVCYPPGGPGLEPGTSL